MTWNWELISILVTVVLWSIGNLLYVGIKLGTIQTDLTYIKKMVGNGTPGVFVRRTEVDLMNRLADSAVEDLSRRISVIEDRDENISG
jgi:hypothetical protein